MLLTDQSLCQLDGLSPNAEVALRNQGIWTARQLAFQADNLFSPLHAARIKESFLRFELFRKLGLVDALVKSFPCGHRVRVLADYLQQAMFLDIESTGTMLNKSHITCISIYRNGVFSSFVRGNNLPDFLQEWAATKLVVTFNGKRFDIPMLLREFRFTTIPAHIDLMEEASHFGYKGGLKSIEKQIGFQRKENVGEDGQTAVYLWHNYKNDNSLDVLDKLLLYNREDVRSLTFLWRIILKCSLENTGIPLPRIKL